MKGNGLKINENDNVVVVTDPKGVTKGSLVNYLEGNDFKTITLNHDVPPYHKVCIKAIDIEVPVIKYGESIGVSTKEIKIGDYVHNHNLKSQRE